MYFVADDRTIWRIPVDAAGRASGAPRPWLTLTGRLEAETDSLDFSADGSRLIMSVVERAADIWLVERRPATTSP